MAEFAETAVLVDVMNGDDDTALDRLRQFTRRELNDLSDYAGTLDRLIAQVCREHPHEPV